MTPTLPRLDDALAHTDWVRRLARSLVNEADAEDLAQDAWQAALSTSAEVERGWLAGVLHNLAAMRHRTLARRTRREAGVTEPEPAPAPDEVLERLQTQRLLSDLVAALPEPVRVVLYLRYYEGLDATAIGARLEVPPGTVRWRLKQGVDALRERLDAQYGERQRWSALLVPLAGIDPSPLSLVPGALLMKMKSLVAIAVALVLAVLGAWWWWPAPANELPLAERSTSGASRGQVAATSGGEALAVAQSPLPAWKAQPAAPARHVAGHVTLAGAPLRGARVLLFMKEHPTAAPPQQRLSDATGAFDFGAQQPLEVVVSANLDGHASTVVELDLRNPDARPSPGALELKLADACEARLVGRVLDSGAGPVPSAMVRPAYGVGVSSNQQGEYELCAPAGMNTLYVEADGYGAVELRALVLGRTHRDVVLAPEALIVGQVVDDVSGAPVSDALVTSRVAQYQKSDGARGVLATSDAAGRFQLHVAPGDYKVMATAGGTTSSPLQVVSAYVGRLSDEVVLRVRAGVEVRGVVRSAGTPIGGAHVRAHTVSTGRSVDAFSQADGRFVLRGVPVGALIFTASPWSVTQPRRYEAAAGGPEVELEVVKQGTLRGVVTRAHQPVEGALVDLSRGTDDLKATSDAQGRYQIDGVPRGRFSLVVSSEKAGAFMEIPELKFGLAEDRQLDVELESAASIEGTVVDAQGQAVAGALVVFSDARETDEGRGIADSDGKFRATQMKGGTTYFPKVFASGQQASASKPAGAPFAGVSLADGNAHVEGVRLQVKVEKLQLSGRVVDPSGEPVPDVKLRAETVGSGGAPQFSAWQLLPQVMSDAQGRFTFDALTSGTWAIQGRSPAGAEAVVRGEAGAKDVVLTLRPSARVDGRLVGYSQTPLVYARPLTGGRLVAGQVTGERFSISLPAGTWVVSVMDNQEGEVKRVELKDGEVKQVTMTSHGVGVLRGRVVDHETQAPMADLVCHPVLATGDSPGTTNWEEESSPKTDADGRFEANPVPAGRVAVMCQGGYREMSLAIALLTVERGGTAEVTMELVLRGAGAPGDAGLSFDELVPTVIELKPGGPAARAGVKVGDVVSAVDGKPVGTIGGQGTQMLVVNHPPGTPLSLTITRAGAAPRSVTMTTE